jgi:hypothetical protein
MYGRYGCLSKAKSTKISSIGGIRNSSLKGQSHEQIGIRGGARSFQLRGGSIKQNESFEKSQELKGRSENFKK